MEKEKADGHKLCRSCRFPSTTLPLPSSPPPSPYTPRTLVKKEISLLLFLIVLDIQLSPLIKRDEKKWEKVIFSDETHLYIGPQGQVWVQRPLGEAYNPDYMINQVAHPERVSIWGCFLLVALVI